MKKTVYYVFAALITLGVISCNEKDEALPSLTGMWNYTRPHFEFDYHSDSIAIEMYRGKRIAIATADFKKTYLDMATEKMGSYFQGLEVLSADELRISAQRQTSVPLTIGAAYQQTDEFIQITLNREDMQQLAGENADMIPAVSFKYSLRNETLTLYLDAAYIRTIYARMEDRIVAMIVGQMDIDFSRLPAGTKEKVTEGVKKQIPSILDNIVRLEVGFVLTKAQ